MLIEILRRLIYEARIIKPTDKVTVNHYTFELILQEAKHQCGNPDINLRLGIEVIISRENEEDLIYFKL